MTPGLILIDLLALLLAAIGLLLAFRQRLVRRLWTGLRGRAAKGPRPNEEDPVHYALIIFGVMLMAFGLIIFAFATGYAFA
jgi:hypothetical protein